jgi:hypothetical protein
MSFLSIPEAELAERLSVPLAPRQHGWALTVTQLSVPDVADGEQLRMVLTVKCRENTDDPDEWWRVSIPVDRDIFDSAVSPQALRVTLRANLEEWWDTKAFDPWTGLWGTRLENGQVSTEGSSSR